MPHIHAQYDFVVAAFLVNQGRVCLLKHKKLGAWLSPGGHIELHQTPDEALWAEILEETGLKPEEVKILVPPHMKFRPYPKDAGQFHNSKQLVTPWAVECHDFPPVQGHKHIANVYIGRAKTDRLVLEAHAADEIRWFSKEALINPEIPPTIAYYGCMAIDAAYLDERHEEQTAKPTHVMAACPSGGYLP